MQWHVGMNICKVQCEVLLETPSKSYEARGAQRGTEGCDVLQPSQVHGLASRTYQLDSIDSFGAREPENHECVYRDPGLRLWARQ